MQLARKAEIDRISWRATLGDDAEVIAEINPVRARFGNLDVALPPLAFLQPTISGERALVDAVMEVLPPTGKFADLFSGCGTFTGPMLERGPVDAYESVGPAIRALEKSRGQVSNPLRGRSAAISFAIRCTPRQKPIATTSSSSIRRVPAAKNRSHGAGLPAERRSLVGVSCNPATFARDARILADGGYRLESVKVIDQFTWSHHIELVAAFIKREAAVRRSPLRKDRRKK